MCALVRFLRSVNEGMGLQGAVLTERLIALWAVVRFLPFVYEGVPLQITILTKRLVTLYAVVFDSTVPLLVTEKVARRRKCLRTQVAISLVLHRQLSPPSPFGFLFLLLK